MGNAQDSTVQKIAPGSDIPAPGARPRRGPALHRERHARAFHCCVPCPPSQLRPLLPHPLQPDVCRGRAWIDVCLTYMDEFAHPLNKTGRFETLPHVRGWQMKLSLLVTCQPPSPPPPPPTCDDGDRNPPSQLRGHFLTTIFFDDPSVMNRMLDCKGICWTTPAGLSTFNISSDRRTANGDVPVVPVAETSMDPGTLFSAQVMDHCRLKHITVEGELEPLDPDDAHLLAFLLDRPNKFMLRNDNATDFKFLVWEPLREFESSAEGCVGFMPMHMHIPLLSWRFGLKRPRAAIDLKNAFCFVQPGCAFVDGMASRRVDWVPPPPGAVSKREHEVAEKLKKQTEMQAAVDALWEEEQLRQRAMTDTDACRELAEKQEAERAAINAANDAAARAARLKNLEYYMPFLEREQAKLEAQWEEASRRKREAYDKSEGGGGGGNGGIARRDSGDSSGRGGAGGGERKRADSASKAEAERSSDVSPSLPPGFPPIPLNPADLEGLSDADILEKTSKEEAEIREEWRKFWFFRWDHRSEEIGEDGSIPTLMTLPEMARAAVESSPLWYRPEQGREESW